MAGDTEAESVPLQAFFSGTAKMCVRELRSTEVPNVVVFYLAFVSTLGALAGTIIQVRPPSQPSAHQLRMLHVAFVVSTAHAPLLQICLT